MPLVVRGAGTGYTGGAVPTQRRRRAVDASGSNRILEIDDVNLVAVVEPAVITGDLQRAVEARGPVLSARSGQPGASSIGGNVAECAGGPRAFKYGTTKRYVLALEAVLPTGEIIRTGSKAVKNVVGYDLTQLLVGSEGTLAIVTEVTLRLVPLPPARAALVGVVRRRARRRWTRVTAVIQAGRRARGRSSWWTSDSLRAVEAYVGEPRRAAARRRCVIVECDGMPAGVEEEIDRASSGAVAAPARSTVVRAASETSASACGPCAASCRSRCAPPALTRSTTTWWCRAAACRSCSTRSSR